jgi:hypothetical protein
MHMTPLTATQFSDMLNRAVTEPGIISKAYTAFYGYSIGNRLLAMFQCMERDIEPGPIATFMGWKDKGRYVRKGEKALSLCMPVTCKARKAETTDDDSDSATFTRFVFRPNWFVLSQTDGADATFPTMADWQLERALEALSIASEPFTHLDGNCQGYARERTIAVSPVAVLPHKTTFHEIAHILLGHTSESATLSDSERTPRSLREVEAEAVAMVCCEALNLAGAAESRGYIQNWNQSSEPIPERSAQKIFKVANQILEAGRADLKPVNPISA